MAYKDNENGEKREFLEFSAFNYKNEDKEKMSELISEIKE